MLIDKDQNYFNDNSCISCGSKQGSENKACWLCLGQLEAIAEREVANSIVSYLQNEIGRGCSDFRVHHQGNGKIIIHPLGKDGGTLDIEIKLRNTD